METQPFKPLTLYDQISTLEAGMNSGLSPLLIDKNQLAFAGNLTVRNGFASDRPPYTKQLNITYPSPAVQTAVEQGLFQGAAYYQPDQGNQSLFAAISGRLFQFQVSQNDVTVTERTVTGDPNPSTTTQAWLWQSENYLIWQDGVSLPVFFDGTTSRRSAGPSVLLATATTSTSPAALVIPAIGDEVVLTLAAPWPDIYNVPVLFHGEYYQPIANSGGYVVNLTSLYSVGGTPINVNDAVNIVPGYAGVIANPIALPSGAPFNFPNTLTVTLTAPYLGTFNPTFVGNSGKVIMFGKVWAAISAVGNTLELEAGEPGVFPATLASGTILQYVAAPAPNVLIGFNTIATTDPGITGTVQLTLTQAYNGPANAIVFIGAAQYTIAAVVPPPGIASVTMVNLTDASVGPYVFGTGLDILSVPELPAGRMGCYGLGQNWMVLVDGLSYICSDESRGPSGTQANNYRDAVLKTTDLSFRGGSFAIPGAGNVITSMTFTANLDVALGQGSLEIGTAQFMASALVPFDFTNPNNESPALTYSLIGTGPLGQDSTIRVNSDIYFRATNGLGSLVLARRDFQSPGNTPISEEMNRVLDLDDQTLLTYGSSCNFNNRFLTTVSPQASSQGVIHPGLIALNLDPVSSMRGKKPPVYDGLWTGVNVLKLVQGNFAGKDRAFAFTFNIQLSKIELYELLPMDAGFFDNGSIPIVWNFETASLFREDVKSRNVMASLRGCQFDVDSVLGTVRFQWYYRADSGTCWQAWHSFQVCNSGTQPINFQRLSLGEPSSNDCDPVSRAVARDGYTFQFKCVITGQCRLTRAMFMAVTVPTPKWPAPNCDITVEVLAPTT